MTWPKLDMSAGAINRREDGTCWICCRVPGQERHHIIPRAYGGEHGPLVDLCGNHHKGGVHRLADEGLESLNAVFPDVSGPGLQVAKQCAIAIVKAKALVKGDANKTTVYSDRMPARTNRQLKALARAFKRPQTDVVRYAIAELHRRHFGKD